ncbi:lipopolysaccharide kinase InaA family protein [Pseudomonas sp. PS01300]|uniref:lipopolysaccharide kinase InaA family protein n=1 Tax=Pseudomonas sp. PS01300 TaxID=2991436 RepID=UPI00249ADA87|nr:lipopolysaccharide kinase InaA family protein [Pseudomonas sp. PS01300]
MAVENSYTGWAAVREGKNKLVDGFPYTLKHQRSTLHLKTPVSASTTEAFTQLLSQKRQAKRVSAPLPTGEQLLFAKRQVLETLPKKIRFARGTRKRCGMFDWPIEELINTAEAHRRGASVPGVVGYGYTKSRFGLMDDFFIITELLQNYTDGYQWILARPEEVERVIAAAFELMYSLNSSGIYHMDLWAANMMMCNEGVGATYAIDLENCFAQKNEFLSETLGFQFGFFFLREVNGFFDEARYDAKVELALKQYAGIDRERFRRVYQVTKHQHVGRKERREVFLRGVVPLADITKMT